MSLIENKEDDYNSDEDEDYVLPTDAPVNVNADLLTNKDEEDKEDEKPTKNADDLWADFLKEDEPSTSENKEKEKTEAKKVVEVYDFAGETVKVEKTATSFKRAAPKGGMDNILAAMKKPKKMSVLDKSSHDWNKLVAKEGIAEELSQHNKSKGSYLDKQKFLNSVDQAKFLKEKEARDKNRIPL